MSQFSMEDLCKLFAEIAEKCNPEEVEALNEVWGRMERAETLLEWRKIKEQEKIPIVDNGGWEIKEENIAEPNIFVTSLCSTKLPITY